MRADSQPNYAGDKIDRADELVVLEYQAAGRVVVQLFCSAFNSGSRWNFHVTK